MSLAVAEAVDEELRIVHAIPGRVRVRLPGWDGRGQRSVEARMRGLRGVLGARANPLTLNVLVRFDPAETDEESILAAARTAAPDEAEEIEREAEAPPVQRERRESSGAPGRTRIAVRRLDRNPELARRVVERLESFPTVRATASQLTGRVLVEFDEHRVELEDLVSVVAGVELPEVPGEDRPAHPMDRERLVQSGVRTSGAAVGLGLLGVRRLLGLTGPPIAAAGPANMANAIAVLESFPVTRRVLHRLLGRNLADLVASTSVIVLHTIAGAPLNLAIAGAGALRVFTEARARREAWRNYEERVETAAPSRPGAIVRLEPGERAPLAAEVVEGAGTALGRDGLPEPVHPGGEVEAGSKLYGGPFTLRLRGGEPFAPQERPQPRAESLRGRYVRVSSWASLAFAGATAVFTRSIGRTLGSLLLVSPRISEIGARFANTSASARVLRAGVTVVGTRPDRVVRRPDVLLLDGPRTLTDGLEVNGVVPQAEGCDASEVLALASGVAAAAGSPWDRAFPAAGRVAATDGNFDGETATARIKEVRYSLGPVEDGDSIPAATRLKNRGSHLLMLRSERAGRALGIVALRPRLAAGTTKLVETCAMHGTEVSLVYGGDSVAAQSVARRAGVSLLTGGDALEVVRERQESGEAVALVSDTASSAPGFAACDLAIGLTSGRNGNFAARADLLAPDFDAVSAIVEAGARREKAARDSVALSIASNVAGAALGFRGARGIEHASLAAYAAISGAMLSGWARLRGGKRQASALSLVPDPRPERWGREDVASVLRSLETTEEGLTSEAAAGRRQATSKRPGRNALLGAILDQIRFAAHRRSGGRRGALAGARGDLRRFDDSRGGGGQRPRLGLAGAPGRAGRRGPGVARDRDRSCPARRSPGDHPGRRGRAWRRAAAGFGRPHRRRREADRGPGTRSGRGRPDGRVALPAPKQPDAAIDAARVVLEGSDVTVGTGRAVVVATGRHTRMGATAAALDLDEEQQGALGARLNRLLKQMLPLIVAGGALVTASGLLWRRPLMQQLAVGASIAIAVVPEGLPLLAGTGEAAAARRLARRNALVRRLSAVETLGRVDVACADKTGTLTEGRLALSLVAGNEEEAVLPGELSDELRQVLLTAALASPHPDSPDAASHPTDVAVVWGARKARFGRELRAEREDESPFDPAQSFHASSVGGRVCVKGAAEALVPRCDRVRRGGEDQPLDEAGRRELLARAEGFAERGLRVLMVAEGPRDAAVDDPGGLVALGFLGISDPLRNGVSEAVWRCHQAGVRVMMLTGDHPATARAIARDAGLPLGENGEILTGEEIAELDNGELDERLEHAIVISRITPLDKLRIVESLKRRGHTVAMMGDGVNDAPALRLADVGVAMGRGGTEVARQAADVVLADDDFSTLIETLVEGRSFWRNIRRALGLLLGGNLGELGLMVGATALSPVTPLSSRQILAVNLVSDVLPAVAVAFQRPAHRNLAGLDREGEAALERPLRNDVIRRGIATATPSLAAYLVALGSLGVPQAGSVAFASVVSTQLAQTLALGRNEGGYSRSVLGAVAGSSGLLLAALTVPPLRAFLNLAAPASLGWLLIGAASLAAVPLNRLLSFPMLLGAAPPPPQRNLAPANRGSMSPSPA